MGLFSNSSGACHFCQGEVEEGNGMYCDTCDTFVHTDCLRRNNLLKINKKILRSNDVRVKCPSCGETTTVY